MSASLADEIAASAARLVVEEGLDYGSAKRRAARDLGRGQVRQPDLPSNEAVEDEVREYLALFCADTQPAELAALRGTALTWMGRFAEFRPHLAGAVWRGTATRLNPIHLELYADDPKAPEIAMINLGADYDTGEMPDGTPALRLEVPCRELGESATLLLSLHDTDDLRGALKPDSRGRTWRGDAAALRRLLDQPDAEAAP